MKVDIISRELIKPSSPTPFELRDFKLSFIDESIPPFFVPLILYYTGNETTDQINQLEMVNRLRTSLADILIEFYPLAGRMKDQILVDCNDQGVGYLVARVDGDLQRLIDSPEVHEMDQLIPYKSKGSILMDDEQLAIQVNLFKCGGLAIGFCISHRIADGCSLCTFIKAWTDKTRQNINTVCPIFDSASLFPPRNTPDVKPNPKGAAVQPAMEKLVAKQLTFTASAIAEMKAEVINNSSITQPTRVELVSALLWKCCVAAKGVNKRGKSAACLPLNLRGKMVPQLQDSSFGNIFQVATAVTSTIEINWISLVGKLRTAIKKIDRGYIERLLRDDGFELHTKNFNEIKGLISEGNSNVVRYSIWCNFGIYESDFGWGNPAWVSSAAFSIKDSIYLFDSKCPGGVEAWIVMAEEDMAKLEQDMELKVFTSLTV